MLDILDILNGRAAETNPATYYPRKPEAVIFPTNEKELYALDAEAMPIDVEILDPTSYALRSLFSDITDTSGYLAVKTRDQVPFRVGGFIATADTRLYIIDAVTVDTSSASKQAMRFNPIPLGTTYILRLMEVENERRLV
ncbi:MAG: hypothetical protein IKL79_01280 [Clostridia bacterium]|nr:hypothetical protein [Clostridia bacterium]